MRDFAASATPEPVTSTIDLPGSGPRVVWRQGTGRPLLLIQGMSGTHDHWGDALVERLLTDGRMLVGINHRGVYKTDAPEPGYSVEDLADDQAAALDVLGVQEPIDVFGISMGGMVAQSLALRHPEKVRTLALGCTTAGGALMTFPSQEDLQNLFAAQQSGDFETAMRAGFEVNFSPALWDDAALYARFKELTALAPVPIPVIMGQAQAISLHDTGARLNEITVPVAVLHGTRDRMLPYPNGVAVHQHIPGATLETFEEAGHLFFWDHAARTAEVLAELSARSPE
ncbi:MAG: alpha/beta fold hydrolase [Patulibacter minatonensis]